MAKSPAQPELLPAPVIDGVDETVLAQWPCGPLDDHQPPAGTRLAYRVGEQVWEVVPSEKYGHPTAVEDDVYMALLTYAVEQGMSQTVTTTYRELLERLGWDDSGGRRKRLSLALDRLATTTVEVTHAYGHVDPEAPKLTINRIDAKAEVGTGGARSVRVRFGDTIWASIQAGRVKPLPYGTYRTLANDAAKRIYRYLDALRHADPKMRTVTLDLRELAHERLGINRAYTSRSHIVRQLNAAHAELKRVGMLTDDPIVAAVGRCSTITYHLGHADQEYAHLVQLLTERHVTASVAAELVDDHRHRVEEHVEAYDRNGRAKGPALLVEAIREGYAYTDRQLARPRVRNKRADEPAQAALDMADEVDGDLLPTQIPAAWTEGNAPRLFERARAELESEGAAISPKDLDERVERIAREIIRARKGKR